MYETVKKGWERSSADLAGSDAFWERGALTYSLIKDIKKWCLIPEHIHGKVLDAGAGKLSYRHLVKTLGSEYKSLDVKATHPDLDYVSDVQNMSVPSTSFDTVVSFEVLEHVPDPKKALAEIYRVLRPGGKLVMSTPFQMYLHNEPNDYYRYTHYALRILLEEAGFTVVVLKPSGGLFCFLQGMIATVIVGLTYGIPLIWPVVSFVNRLVSEAMIWLDDHTDPKKILPLHYVAVAQKPKI